ncbi:Os07g0643500 [Oryza sativa Japonica Group]|uniref:Os07g0643500 protein n=1 Tax=Oryza sativa subsp. japonica TaxID=39947 RepID=Q0D467_ORYSJ|nr:Os07g0643500 [Oryza sativa Japonica Group]|eukprot:NP_001060442.1 Os07g0643500 [Oryza sativa Japonica Group]
MLTTGPTPSSLSSASVRSSPPKNGCSRTTPARRTRRLEEVVAAAHRCATWWAMLPPALSPTRKQRVRSTGTAATTSAGRPTVARWRSTSTPSS